MEVTAERLKRANDNLDAWSGICHFETRANLDSSLKKNTSFIKRIRLSIGEDNKAALLDGVRSLTLAKYINELVPALFDSLLKLSRPQDISAAVEVISALHQRFPTQFTPTLMACVAEYVYLNIKKKANVSEIRLCFQFIMELTTLGVFGKIKLIEDTTAEIPAAILSKENYLLGSLLLLILCKGSARIPEHVQTLIMVIENYSEYITNKADEVTIIIPSKDQTNILSCFAKFDDHVFDRIVSLRDDLRSLNKNKVSSEINTGKEQTKLKSTIDQKLQELDLFKKYADLCTKTFNIEQPENVANEEFKDADNVSDNDATGADAENEKIQLLKPSNDLFSTADIWTDPVERRFYQDIPALSVLVPNIAQKGNKNEDNENAASEGSDDKSNESLDSKGKVLTDILERLDEALCAEDVDKVATEFWAQDLNTKASINRLETHFLHNVRERYKFRNYCRFLKIGQDYFAELISRISEALQKQIRYYLSHGWTNTKSLVLFSELVNFGLLPPYFVLFVIQKLVLSVRVGNNIETLSQIFEICGRTLQFSPAYKDYVKQMVLTLQDIQKDGSIRLEIKKDILSLCMSLSPPEAIQLSSSKETALDTVGKTQLMLRMLVNGIAEQPKRIEKIVALISCINWGDTETFYRMVEFFARPENFTYNGVRDLSKVLVRLIDKHPVFLHVKVTLVDTLMYEINDGMESNHFEDNRKRLAQLRFLACLRNRKLVPISCLSKIEFQLMMSGHESKFPDINEMCALDPKESYFRVRMVAELLLTLKRKLAFSDRAKKLIFFCFFDCYLWTKTRPVPMEIAALLNKIKLAYNIGLSDSYKQALSDFALAIKESGEIATDGRGNSDTKYEEDNEEEDDDDDDDDDDDNDDDDDDDEIGDESDAYDSDDDGDDDGDDDDDDGDDDNDNNDDDDDDDDESDTSSYSSSDESISSIDNLDPDRIANEQLESHLEDEFGRMKIAAVNSRVPESSNSRQSSLLNPKMLLTKAKFKFNGGSSNVSEVENSDSSSTLTDRANSIGSMNRLSSGGISTPASNGSKFTFLRRSGNNVEGRDLVLPSTAKFAQNYMERLEKSEKEKEVIQSIVLDKVRTMK